MRPSRRTHGGSTRTPSDEQRHLLVRAALFDWLAGSILISSIWPAPVLLFIDSDTRKPGDAGIGELLDAFRLCLRVLGLPEDPFLGAHSFRKSSNPIDAYRLWQDKPWATDSIVSHFGEVEYAVFKTTRRAFYLAQLASYLSAARFVGKVPADVYSQMVASATRCIADAAVGLVVERRLAIHGLDAGARAALANLIDTASKPLGDEDHVEALFQNGMSLLSELDPGVSSIVPDVHRARVLVRRLSDCAPGRSDWSLYEDIGIDILRFTLIPPFRRLYAQARTSDGTQRRDALIPNTAQTAFWESVRREYGSKHIVVEFKNLQDAPGPGAINQVRLYLDKPTVGKFGMVITRRIDSDRWRVFQRKAFEERRSLILVLDDEKVRELLLSRAYLGSSDYILEDMKTQFEIEY